MRGISPSRTRSSRLALRVRTPALLALLLAGATACSGETPEAREFPGRGFNDKPVPVVAVQPVRTSLDDVFLEREATLRAVATAQVSTRQEGFVSQLGPEHGDIVHEGDFLAQIDETDTRLQLAVATAEVRNAEASLAEQERTLERAEQLFQRDVLSQGELDDRKTALERSQADLDEAKARRGLIEIELDALRILAPMPGIVTRLYTQDGEYLKRGDKVLELKRIDAVVALCTVSERHLGHVREGSSVYVHVTAFPERTFQGLVWKIIGNALLESRSFPVTVLVSNQDQALKPGMSARVSFVRRLEDGLLVPKDAVVEEDDEHYVFLVSEGHAERRSVDLGAAFGDQWHIRSGVSPEDRVIVTGNEDLMAGRAVMVVDLPPPGPPTLPEVEAPDVATGS